MTAAEPDPVGTRLRLLENGYCPIPAIGKSVHIKGWTQKTATSAEDIAVQAKLYPDHTNTGILTRGTPAIDIDITVEPGAVAVEELARELFEDRGFVAVRIGKPPKRAILLRTDEPFPKISAVFTAPDGSTHKVEILGDGEQVIVDGIHPDTRRPYMWHGGSPCSILREDLPYVRADDVREFLDRAAGVLAGFGFQRVGEKPNGRDDSDDWRTNDRTDWGEAIGAILAGNGLHDAVTALAAKLVVAGTDDGASANLLRALLDASSAPRDDRWRDRCAEISRAINSARNKFAPRPGELFDPWAKYVVPTFPLDVLPPVLFDFVKKQSVAIGGDVSAMAMSVLCAVSGAIDHRTAVRMMRNSDWWASPRIWVVIVGAVSVKKTPLFDAATRPLEAHQKRLMTHYLALLRDYERAREGGDKDAEKPDPPPRWVAIDSTIEKLGEILARSDKGLLVKRDELSGWIGSLEKYANSSRASAADRGFWLKAFDGGAHHVDRIGRGEGYIGNLSVSLLGGIQPERLAELRGLTSDGLLQRFIPVLAAPPTFAQDIPADSGDYARLIQKLITLAPASLDLAPDALDEMTALRRHLFDLEQESGGLAAGFQGFVGKMAGLAGSLALLLHLAGNPTDGLWRRIETQTVQSVKRLVIGFVLPHAFEFYRSSEAATEGDRLQKIASYVLTCRKERVTARDLTHNVPSLRGLELFELNRRISPLVAMGWLDPHATGPLNRTWTVSPAVPEQLEARRQEEERRKAAVAQLMNSPRRGVM